MAKQQYIKPGFNPAQSILNQAYHGSIGLKNVSNQNLLPFYRSQPVEVPPTLDGLNMFATFQNMTAATDPASTVQTDSNGNSFWFDPSGQLFFAENSQTGQDIPLAQAQTMVQYAGTPVGAPVGKQNYWLYVAVGIATALLLSR